jgi:hypothetical protein
MPLNRLLHPLLIIPAVEILVNGIRRGHEIRIPTIGQHSFLDRAEVRAKILLFEHLEEHFFGDLKLPERDCIFIGVRRWVSGVG